MIGYTLTQTFLCGKQVSSNYVCVATRKGVTLPRLDDGALRNTTREQQFSLVLFVSQNFSPRRLLLRCQVRATSFAYRGVPRRVKCRRLERFDRGPPLADEPRTVRLLRVYHDKLGKRQDQFGSRVRQQRPPQQQQTVGVLFIARCRSFVAHSNITATARNQLDPHV